MLDASVNYGMTQTEEEEEKEKEYITSGPHVFPKNSDKIIANSIQIASDIHLEFDMVYDRMPRIQPRAPILAL